MKYPDRYGTWAGNPEGHKADPTRCVQSVYPTGRGVISHQCHKKRGHGPDGAYCKTHDPDEVKRRQDIAMAKYEEGLAVRRLEWSGPKLAEAMRAIAKGHNDPRTLAVETLKSLNISISD